MYLRAYWFWWMSARATQVAVARAPAGGWMVYDRASHDALWIDPFDEPISEANRPIRTPPDLLAHAWPPGLRLRAVAFSHLHRESRLQQALSECGDVPWIVRRCDWAPWQRFHSRPSSETQAHRESEKIGGRVEASEPAIAPRGNWCDPSELGSPLRIGRHQVRFIALPGHTRGSVAVAVADAGFPGDTLCRGGIGTHPRSNEARAALRHSLEQLVYGNIMRDNVTLYCGDGSVTTRAQERRRNGPLALLRSSNTHDETSHRTIHAQPTRTEQRAATQSRARRADAARIGATRSVAAGVHREIGRSIERD